MKSLINMFNECRGQRFTNEDFSKYDLNAVDYSGMNGLLYALKYNKTQNLQLSIEDLDYLIKNTNLLQQTHVGFSALNYALMKNKEQQLGLKIEHFSLLTKAILNEANVKNNGFIIDNVLYDLNEYELSIIWPHIENKHWFCSYAIDKRKSLAYLDEIKNFIEKKQLEAIVEISEISKKPYKI